MNRYDSRVCLLDSDVLEHVDHCNYESDVYAESSSSGYESSDFSDEEANDNHLPLAPPVCPASASKQQPTGRCRSTRTPTCRDVMMLRSTGKLQDNLGLILEMPDMCDVTFLVGRKQVPIYGVKAILATRSRYLYQLILQQQKQVELDNASKKRSKKSKPSPIQHKLCIKVPDYQVEDFRAFLCFVHSGKVEIDSINVTGLLCAAVDLHEVYSDITRQGPKISINQFCLELPAQAYSTETDLSAVQYNQLKFSKRREVSVTAHPWDPEEDWRHRWRTSTTGLSGLEDDNRMSSSGPVECRTALKEAQLNTSLHWFPLDTAEGLYKDYRLPGYRFESQIPYRAPVDD